MTNQNLMAAQGEIKAQRTSMRWFRMYAEFATDPKVQMLSETDQRRFLMLLCLRCGNGDVTLQDDECAFQLRVTEAEYAQTKAVLIARGLIDADNKPTAWERRQYLSDTSKHRVSRHRERKRLSPQQTCNVTVTPPDTDTDTEAETESEKKESHVTASIPDAARSRLAGLNGSLETILSDVVSWGVAPDQAPEYLAAMVDRHGPEATREGYAKLKTDLARGGAVKDPAALMPAIVRRVGAGDAAKTASGRSKMDVMREAIRTMGTA